MRSRLKEKSSQMPELNLVPMMDVIMTILTFFIIVSMTLTNQQRVLNVNLPSTNAAGSTAKSPESMVIGLNTQNQIIFREKPIAETELAQQMQDYLTKNPQGAVLLKADRKVPYEQLAKLLGTMQKIGGERVSLAIETN
jgi:biopolymer transport protein ExbD